MKFEKHINLKHGIAALALIAAGGLMASPAIATHDKAGMYDDKDAYMSDMGERISKADKEFNDNPEAQENEEMQSYWDSVQREWQELSEATEENWDAATAEMDEAWDDFEKEWDENFSKKDK